MATAAGIPNHCPHDPATGGNYRHRRKLPTTTTTTHHQEHRDPPIIGGHGTTIAEIAVKRVMDLASNQSRTTEFAVLHTASRQINGAPPVGSHRQHSKLPEWNDGDGIQPWWAPIVLVGKNREPKHHRNNRRLGVKSNSGAGTDRTEQINDKFLSSESGMLPKTGQQPIQSRIVPCVSITDSTHTTTTQKKRNQ